jgi:hypothetical protein
MARVAPLALAVLATSLLLAPPATANTGSITNVSALGDGLFSGSFTAVVDTCADACRWSARVTITVPGDDCAARTHAAVVYASSEQIGPGTHGPSSTSTTPTRVRVERRSP